MTASLDPTKSLSSQRQAFNDQLIKQAVEFSRPKAKQDELGIDPATGAVVNNGGLASTGSSATTVIKDGVNDIGTMRAADVTDSKGMTHHLPDNVSSRGKKIVAQGKSLRDTVT
jgi:hypothetical protein